MKDNDESVKIFQQLQGCKRMQTKLTLVHGLSVIDLEKQIVNDDKKYWQCVCHTR